MSLLLQRILVLRFSSLGDVLLTTPVLQALQQALPNAQIAYATKRVFAPMIQYHPAVSKVFALEPHISIANYRRDLLSFQPDAVLDLHGKMRSLFLKRTIGAPYISTFQQRSFWDTLRVRIAHLPYRPHSTIAHRYHVAAESLLQRKIESGVLRLYLKPQYEERAQLLAQQIGVLPHKKIIVMSPGAMWETKRWPIQHFIELTRLLKTQDTQIVLTGSRAEQHLTDAIHQACPFTLNQGAGRLPLDALGDLLSIAHLFVGNDSGPMHMARALRVPSLAFFGSTPASQFDFTGHRALGVELDCSPCSFHGKHHCPKQHLNCLNKIDPLQAFEAAQFLLNQGPISWVAG